MHLLERLALGLLRVRRYVAPAVLVLSFVVTQVLFRMPEEGLEAGRKPLAPHVVLVAAFLWPLVLGPGDPTSVQMGTVTAVSTATVLVTLLAIPLWAGHGCWASHLHCFVLFLMAGLALALVLSPLGATAFFCGYVNGYLGYLPTEQEYHRGGYQVEWNPVVYGPEVGGFLMPPVPETADHVVEKVLWLAKRSQPG